MSEDHTIHKRYGLENNARAPKCATCGREWEAYLDGEKMDRVAWAVPGDNGALVTMEIGRDQVPRVRYTLHTGKVVLKRVS